MALATRRAATGDATAPLTSDDLRAGQHERRAASTVIFVVDASASMGVERRMAATKSAVLGLLGDAYRRRGTVGLITFRGETAEVVLRPTGSVEIARARLNDLATGGRTPLAAGLDQARLAVADSTSRGDADCTVVLVTDGRATVGEPDPVTAARVSFEALARTGARLVVLDTETGPSRLSLATELATSVGRGVPAPRGHRCRSGDHRPRAVNPALKTHRRTGVPGPGSARRGQDRSSRSPQRSRPPVVWRALTGSANRIRMQR